VNIRARLQRKTNDHRKRFVYIAGKSFRRGMRLNFQATHPKFGILMQGWFVADSDNPIVKHIEWPEEAA